MSGLTPVRLADVITDAKTGFACGDEGVDGVFQIRMHNVTRGGALDLRKRRRVPPHHRAIRGSILHANDVLFNATNSPDLVGKAAVFHDSGEPTTFSNHFFRLRTDRNRLTADYLAHWLQFLYRTGTFKSMCRQWVNQATVSRESLLAMTIPLCPVDDQLRISRLLNGVNLVRTKRRETIVHLESLSHSIFDDSFGDLIDNDRGWPKGNVADLVANFESGRSFAADSSVATTPHFRVLKVSAVTTGKFLPAESKPVPPEYTPPHAHVVRKGDLIFSRANTASLIGATAHATEIPDNLLLPDKLWRFVWHDESTATPLYILQLFRQRKFRIEITRRSSGTSDSMKNITKANVLSIECGLPPVELRHSYERAAQKIETLGAKQLVDLTELDALFASLQYRAFRGELWPDRTEN